MSGAVKLNDVQRATLKVAAVYGPVRSSRYPAIRSLVKRGLLHRVVSKRGRAYYGVTEAGKQAVESGAS